MSGGSLPEGMSPAVGGSATPAELGTTTAATGLPNLPQQSALQSIASGMQSMAGKGLMAPHTTPTPAAPMAHHAMSGAPVQFQGLLGSPHISVPQVNQMLAHGLFSGGM
jgi:hypothetical protein